MGQSRGGGYQKKDILSGNQRTLLDQLLGQALPNQQQAAQGFQQFLPGGGGGEPIANQALQNYQQRTIPSILNSFSSGGNAKGSSALNQALAASASNLNTDLASQLAQLQLSASSGLGGLGSQQGGLGLGTSSFALTPKGIPFWQQALLGGIGAGGQFGKGYLGGQS